MAYRYRDIFPRRHTLIVVVHTEESDQAIRNAKIAFDAGADGIFLINHSIPATKLLTIYTEVRFRFPDAWIGLNLLDLEPVQVFSRVPGTASGIWIDDAGEEDPVVRAHMNWSLRTRKKDWGRNRALYFGGVAFKYLREVEDLEYVSKLACKFMDVITTSGTATGLPPDVRKIERMRKAIVNFPLAIASGITPENVREYRPFVDCFLVATGISRSDTELDPRRTERFVKNLKG